MHYYTLYWTDPLVKHKGELSFLSFGDAQNHARELEDKGMVNISIYASNRVYESNQRDV